MKENLVLANYKVESEAYQALSELKRETTNPVNENQTQCIAYIFWLRLRHLPGLTI